MMSPFGFGGGMFGGFNPYGGYSPFGGGQFGGFNPFASGMFGGYNPYQYQYMPGASGSNPYESIFSGFENRLQALLDSYSNQLGSTTGSQATTNTPSISTPAPQGNQQGTGATTPEPQLVPELGNLGARLNENKNLKKGAKRKLRNMGFSKEDISQARDFALSDVNASGSAQSGFHDYLMKKAGGFGDPTRT